MAGFLRIGSILAERPSAADPLRLFLNRVPEPDESRKDRLVIILDIRTTPASGLRISTLALDDISALKHAWVRDRSGPNSLKARLTHSTFTTVIGEGIWTTALELEKRTPGSTLASALAEIERGYFVKLGTADKVDPTAINTIRKAHRAAWILDLNKFDTSYPAAAQFQGKKAREEYGKAVEAKITKQFLGRPTKPPGSKIVYTLAVNGRPVGEDEEYREFLAQDLASDSTGQEGKPTYGNRTSTAASCTICGHAPAITHPVFVLSSFTSTNDPLFWNLSKSTSLTRAPRLALCASHHHANQVGQNWVQNKLAMSLGGEQVMLVPAPAQGINSEEALSEIADWLRGSVARIDQRPETAEKISALAARGHLTAIDAAFYSKGGNKGVTKFLRIVPHIPPERITRLIESQDSAERWALDRWGMERALQTSFPGLTFLREVYADGSVGKRMDIVAGALSGHGIPDSILLRDVLMSIERVWREKPHLLDGHLARSMGLFRFFEEAMDDWSVKRVREFDKLTEERRSMVAFGRVLAQGRSLQFKESGHDTMLAYVDFRGMSLQRVRAMAVRVLEKAVQLRGSTPPWMEASYGEGMSLGEARSGDWPLTDQENVALVLWGMVDERLRAKFVATGREETA